MIKIFTFIFMISLFSTSLHADLVADYHFDACYWDGSSSEAKDSSGNDYHADTNNNPQTMIDGKLNTSANLLNNHYLSLSNTIAIDTWSVTVWIKFPFNSAGKSGDDFYYVLGSVEGDGDLAYFTQADGDSDITWGVYDNSQSVKTNDFPDDLTGWHHITLTNDKSVTKLYIDGSYYNEVSTYTTGNLKIIGSSTDDPDGQTIGAYIDEFKLFDTTLSSSEINTIYNNETNQKNYDGTTRTTIVCSISSIPNADYHFDSCSWDGTSGEVKENIHDYHGTAHTVLPSKDALLLHSANVSADSTSDYISLDHRALDGLNAFTISAWIKTGTGDYQTIISGANSDQDNEVLLWLRDSGKIEFFIKGVRTGALDIPDIQDNKWHHIVWSREDKHAILYIDGVKKIDGSYSDDATLGSVTIDTDGLVLGLDQDSVGGDLDQTFLGKVDEVKIFDKIISFSEVQILYKNDQLGRNYDGAVRAIPTCSLTSDYHFDSCAWDGTSNEVIDYSGHALHATDIDGATVLDAKINHGASFDGDDDYIDLPDIDADFSQGFTISAWVRFDTDGSYQKIIEITTGRGENGIGLTRKADTNKLVLEIFENMGDDDDANDNYEGIETSDDVIDGNMHHIVATLSSNKHAKIYIDGVEKASGTFGFMPANVTRTVNYIAKSTWTGDGDDYFGGIIDEFKIFDLGLTATQIQTIYDNENNSKDYNGTAREAVDCSMPSPVADYHLDECDYDGTDAEVIDSSAYTHNLTSTTGTSSIATGEVERAAQFDGVDGKIAGTWNQSFPKEVTLTAWIKTDNPEGDDYARVVEFSDSTGNYKVSTGLVYNNDGTTIRGWTANSGENRTNEVTYDLSANGYHDNNWHFIAYTYYHGVCKLYVDGVKVDSDFEDIGTIQTGETISIGGRQLSNSNNSYQGAIDEVKVFDRSLTPAFILDIYNNEKAGKNYGGTLRAAITCAQAVLNAVNQNGGCFNWDNNITTKIADKAIDLTILARDSETNTSMSDVNITQLDLLSFSDASCATLYDTTTLWSGNSQVDADGCFNPASFTHNKAIKCAKIHITALYDDTTVESNSSDTFSIRPERLTLTPTLDGKLTSEHNYHFQVQANNYQNTTQTPDYNQSITPTSTLKFREGTVNDGSLEGTFTFDPSNITFSDGLTTEGNLSFNNVGIVTLELNDTTWAEVDSDDTPLAERSIYTEHNLTFIPDHFAITYTSPIMTNYIDGSFTYLSNDLNMSAWLKNLSVTLTAEGENNATMTNYETPQSLFYANDINITTSLHVLNDPIMITPPSSATNAHLSFIDGVADLNYSDVRFNYPRDYKTPVNPIMIAGSDAKLSISVIDTIDTTVEGEKNSTFGGDATFYYGKIIPEDIKTAKNSVASQSLLEIYSDTILAGFERVTSNWYINKEDNFSTIDTLTAKTKRTLSSDTNTYTSATNLQVANQGKITYDLTNTHDSTYKAFYHLDIPTWLWHSRYSDYNASSDCSQHPCFEYIYESDKSATGITSGTFKGSHFDNDFNNTRERKAIKILR